MHAFDVNVIDANGVFHQYTQIAASCAAAESIAFDRFGSVRVISVRRKVMGGPRVALHPIAQHSPPPVMWMRRLLGTART